MTEDIKKLKDLNEKVNRAENAGDMKAFKDILAPMFAFQRANGVDFDDRHAFMQKPKPGDRTIEIESIDVRGNRAIVTCFVLLDGKKYSASLCIGYTSF